ncbi:MAG: Zn-dependent hydrolase [Beijerinckiaceae bacterium]|nr:Zn-dependent hydrolase [Beijerinckiaceae bacterium]
MVETLRYQHGRPPPLTTTHNLRINGERLWGSLIEMARVGGTPRGGCNRQTLTPEDRQGRLLFKRWCEEAGMSVRVDRLGSMFARFEGRENLAPIVIGSHLDTQPTGGKFDGVLGVLAGLEAVRCLRESGYTPRRPIEIVNWTNEEGCRFTPVMMGSSVFAGVFPLELALTARDAQGAILADELAKMELTCDAPMGGREIAAYLELHIEQGPILEDGGYDIGFVSGGQGHKWYDVELSGYEQRAGTTPMPVRRDALVGAAYLISEIRRIGLDFAPLGVATVGFIQARPNSRNVIPGEVLMSVDLRHPDGDCLAAMHEAFVAALEATRDRFQLDGKQNCVSEHAPVSFDARLLDVVRRISGDLGLRGRDIISGAGHDAFHLARISPTAMIFTPCRGGVSHNESEDITREWATNGATVLLRTALELAETL